MNQISKIAEVVLDSELVKRDKVEDDEEAGRAAIRERVGLTYEELCRVVADGIKANVALIRKDTGEQCGEVPAHSVRAKFAPLAAEMLGAKKVEGAAQRCPQINIHLPPGFSFK